MKKGIILALFIVGLVLLVNSFVTWVLFVFIWEILFYLGILVLCIAIVLLIYGFYKPASIGFAFCVLLYCIYCSALVFHTISDIKMNLINVHTTNYVRKTFNSILDNMNIDMNECIKINNQIIELESTINEVKRNNSTIVFYDSIVNNTNSNSSSIWRYKRYLIVCSIGPIDQYKIRKLKQGDLITVRGTCRYRTLDETMTISERKNDTNYYNTFRTYTQKNEIFIENCMIK